MPPQPSLTALAGLQLLFFRYQGTVYCYYYYYCGCPSTGRSYPDTITLVTLIKRPIIANPGCFPWTRQAKNYGPHRGGPLLQLPFREYLGQWQPPFLLPRPHWQPQLPRYVLQCRVPITWESAPPPPPRYYYMGRGWGAGWVKTTTARRRRRYWTFT